MMSLRENIFLSRDFLCATNGSKLYIKYNPDYKGLPLLIPRKMMSVLSVGDRIGNSDSNTFLYFDSGIAMFSSDRLSEYPHNKIKSFADESFSDSERMFPIEELNTAFINVETVLFKETRRLANLKAIDRMLTVTAQSLNGTAKFNIPRDISRDFEMTFDIDLVKGITDYDVYIGTQADMLLFLSTIDKNAKIIIMGFK